VGCCWPQVPLSSANPKFEAVLHNKPRLIVLNKADIADQRLVQVGTRLWCCHGTGWMTGASSRLVSIVPGALC
jgi:hypothetical protein